MNDYRQRLEERGYVHEFEEAREKHDQESMTSILCLAGFTPPEIESIIWSSGDIGKRLTPEEKRKEKRKMIADQIFGRIGVGLIAGILTGGAFVYSSTGLEEAERAGMSSMDVLMNDYRDPSEIYYRPFLWGFLIGGVGGIVTGNLILNPFRRNTS